MSSAPITRRLGRWLPPIAVVAVAVAIGIWFVRPVFGLTWFATHDMVAYPVRAIEYVAAWRAGAYWPRWAPDLYGGFGYPLFNYYAPGLFMVTGVLMVIGASAVTALKLALIVFTAIGFSGMFGAVFGECGRADAAAVAATTFVFMGYHLTLLYVRGDLAEYCAISLAPSAIWAYRALGRATPERVFAVGFAAGLLHAATLLLHTITGQWLTEFLVGIAGVTAWQAWRRSDRGRVIAIAVVFVCACGMTAIYSIPALLERPLVHIERMTEGGLATTRNMIDLVWITRHSFFYVGWALLLLPLVAVAAHLRRRRLLPDVAGWTLLTLVLTLLMVRFAAPVWRWLPFGSYMQFPWRLLSFISLFGALAIGAASRALLPRRAVIAWPLAAVCCGAIAYDGWKNLPATILPLLPAQVPATAEDVAHRIQTTVISDEYLPKTVTSHPSTAQSSYVIAAENASVASSLSSGLGYKLEVGGDAGAVVDLRAIWFPGWKVSTGSGPVNAVVGPSPTGLVRLHLPAKGYYHARVYFGLTPLRAAAGCASLLSALALFFALRRLRGAVREPPPRVA